MKFRKVTFLSLLSNIVDNRGKTCPISKLGIPLIATNCIKNENLHPVYEKVRYVDKETYKNWFRGHPKPRDIIFVTKGSPGQTNWVPDQVDFCIAQDMVSLRVNKELVYPKYLFAILRSKKVQHMIESMHVGTLIPHFKKGDFDKLILDIPEDYGEQKWIGDLYFQFCEKIEQNILMNKTLEEMAMAIYKEWFVDFGPFRDGEFVDSELGQIPKGWEVVKIDEAIDTFGGGTPKTSVKEYWGNGEIIWYSPTDLTKTNSLFSLGSEKKITNLGLQKSSAKLFPPYSILMSSRATIGAITINRYEACTNQGFITLVPNKQFTVYQLFGWLHQNMDTINNLANGSTFREISKGVFREFKILKAGDIDNYFKISKPIFDQIENNLIENNTLTETRDYLLPKLISGKVRVKAAEEKMKEVL